MTDEELQAIINDDSSKSTERPSQKEVRFFISGLQYPENFDMIPRFSLLDLIRTQGNAREKLIVFICKHRDSNNLLDMTQEQIAYEAEISFRTVKKEINSLVKQGFIKKKYGVIMVNPEFIVRGSKQKKEYLIKKYLAFGNENNRQTKSENLN